MTLIHPRISVHDPQDVIRKLVELKDRRFRKEISRASFFAAYSQLRIDLEGTAEYAQFREAVIARAGGQCERITNGVRCVRKGRHVHHRVPIAYNPRLALTVTNGEYTCKQCHQASHKNIKLRS